MGISNKTKGAVITTDETVVFEITYRNNCIAILIKFHITRATGLTPKFQVARLILQVGGE